jgi:hypothetical protein
MSKVSRKLLAVSSCKIKKKVTYFQDKMAPSTHLHSEREELRNRKKEWDQSKTKTKWGRP